MSDKPIDKASLLKNLMDNMADSIYFKDLKSRFIMVNRTLAEAWGYSSPEELVGKSDFDSFRQADAQQMYEDEKSIIKSGKPVIGIEEETNWKDGHVAWSSTSKMPLYDLEGNIAGTFGVSRNITDHKIAQIRAMNYAKEMSAIKEEMEEDLHMAGELQKTFFPRSYPVFPAGVDSEESCVDFLHRFEPCSDISVTGDYCSVSRLSDTEAGIFLCDIRSIGVRAALGTALIRGIVQEISSLRLDPGAYLSRLNERLLPLLRASGNLLDITACYLVVNLTSGEVRFASAGHPSPICFPKAGDVHYLVDATGFCDPALAVQSDVTYRTVKCQVAPGDAVILFTDGLCCVKNSRGEPFGGERLLEAARCLNREPLDEIFQGLKNSAKAFIGGGAFTDDICLVGFRLRHLLTSS
ncbi:MAG: SpoIIE family protein phosphatase [Verrucomicrobia bacterium]|nr:SpoIIE family protein phosphatase [Verrucomicrobiota bacterium]